MSSDLPPEAFTKETLHAAFEWLHQQPEPVRSSVQTPERLVSLYRKAQRLNDNDAPVSSKKFITDLKSLASSLDQFQNDEMVAPSQMHPTPSMQPPGNMYAQPQPPQQTAPVYTAPRPPQPQPQLEQPSAEQIYWSSPEQESEVTTETKKASFEVTTKREMSKAPTMDGVTRDRVIEVKERFNLSSESEALRLLVSIGYEKFKHFP